ncbi:MAG: glycosyltransferase family 4 protein [Hyphomicrobiaceae bacterium]
MAAILIDGVHALSRGTTGIGSYTNALASTLRTMNFEVDILCGAPIKSLAGDPPTAISSQVFGQSPSEPPKRVPKLKRLLKKFSSKQEEHRADPLAEISTLGLDLSAMEGQFPEFDRLWNCHDLYRSADSFMGKRQQFLEVDVPESISAAHWTFPLPVAARGVPNVCTIHDVIPLQFPYFVAGDKGRMARLLTIATQRNDQIITVSEASKRHIVEILRVPEERVSVTYQVAPPTQRLPQEEAERIVSDVYGVKPGGYALFVGAIEPKKNLKRLIEAFLLSNTGMPLLIGGPLGWFYEDDVALMDRVKSNAKRDQSTINRLGYLPRRHLVALLQCAKVFLFPSIYEGFGLPVLEALQLGTPALTSRTSSLPEVAGDAAVLVDPLDTTAMAAEISKLCNDDDLRAELSRRGPIQAQNFTLERYQQRLGDAYRRAGIVLPNDSVLSGDSQSLAEGTPGQDYSKYQVNQLATA